MATVAGMRAGESGFVPQYLAAMIWIVVVSVYWGFLRSRTLKQAVPMAEAG
jgi:hypothetical protein